ncbi:DUF6460 domain-containing protein [Methylobacterium sp. NEAU 140]|uniref:DUF6460 domain-containing protein n=1 Tax=Methylobacterium sp. NEAU 140 TaxID=3064945 RepID=UPI0027347391|nr:DUF6460 domain-containing protein [Methylobacterium sp. NEAU 140]MDP4023109.1 DUF6460 domain-containing protein [Methylobacterium sp. NEAU 140]
MLVDHDRRRQGAYDRDPAFGHADRPSALRRFLGGSPAGVFLRLLFLSVLVGAFLSMLGLTPGRLFWHAYDSVRALAEIAVTQLHDVTGWVVAGAVIVVPLWLLSRLFAATR